MVFDHSHFRDAAVSQQFLCLQISLEKVFYSLVDQMAVNKVRCRTSVDIIEIIENERVAIQRVLLWRSGRLDSAAVHDRGANPHKKIGQRGLQKNHQAYLVEVL